MMEKDVYELLTKTDLPVYPVKIPEDVKLPAISYMVVAGSKKQNLDTSYFGEVKRFQVDVWAKSYKDVKDISEDIFELLNEIKAQDVVMQDLYEDEVDVYRVMIDFYLKQ